jgi:hypothetical protein
MAHPLFTFNQRVTIVFGSHAGREAWIASWPMGQDGTYGYTVTLEDPLTSKPGPTPSSRLAYREWELVPRG